MEEGKKDGVGWDSEGAYGRVGEISVERGEKTR
jgi:hypothetical protein